MAFVAPLAEAVIGAEGAAGAAGAAASGSRLGSFASGFKNLLPGSLQNYAGEKPVVAPQKSPIDDVSGLARSTVNPNTTLR